MAKDYFTKNNIEYTDFNVEADDNALADMVKKSGQMGVPVIDIDSTIIVGFDRQSIEHALAGKK
jgi:glutaredoxin